MDAALSGAVLNRVCGKTVVAVPFSAKGDDRTLGSWIEEVRKGYQ